MYGNGGEECTVMEERNELLGIAPNAGGKPLPDVNS